MASKVTPSIPGAPSLLLAISYAARRVSILQTWTYTPQKRQDGSAFALTYILRLRSCKSMDAFIISSSPSLGRSHYKWQGPFAPRTLLRFIATSDPSATLSSSTDFPGSPVIRPTLLRRFLAGTRRASPVSSMSLSPCCRFHPAEVNNRVGQSSAIHAAFAPTLKARPSVAFTLEATTRSLLLRPGDS